LDMPLDDVRLLLDTNDIEARNAIIVAHLQRMEGRLDRTRVAVDSLRAMLSMDAPAPIVVRYRVMSPMLVLAITETVAGDDFGDWLQGVWTELDNVVRRSAHSASGPNGALYEAAFFEESCGPVTAFVPIAGECAGSGRVTMATLPAVTYAITDHRGGFDGIDRTYGALGAFGPGLGSTDIASCLALGSFWQAVPETIQIEPSARQEAMSVEPSPVPNAPRAP